MEMENAVKDKFFPIDIGLIPSKYEVMVYERRMEYEGRRQLEASLNPK